MSIMKFKVVLFEVMQAVMINCKSTLPGLTTIMYMCNTCITGVLKHTVYDKTFEGENFRGFRGFLPNTNVLPLKVFLLCN